MVDLVYTTLKTIDSLPVRYDGWLSFTNIYLAGACRFKICKPKEGEYTDVLLFIWTINGWQLLISQSMDFSSSSQDRYEKYEKLVDEFTELAIRFNDG